MLLWCLCFLQFAHSDHNILLRAGQPYIGLDSTQIITDIEAKGYATFGTKVSTTITEGVEPPK